MVVAKCLASDYPANPESVEPPKNGQSRFVIFTKGAPEVILGKCSKVRHGKDLREIDEKYKKECQVTLGIRDLGHIYSTLGCLGDARKRGKTSYRICTEELQF